MLIVEQTYKLESSLEEVYKAITDLKDYSWRSDIDKIRKIDSKHFLEIEYGDKKKSAPDFITFITVLRKTKDKAYDLNIVNNVMEGNVYISMNQIDNKIEITIKHEMDIGNKNKWFFKIGKTGIKSIQKRYITDLKKKLAQNE